MLRMMTRDVTSFSVTLRVEIGYLQVYRDYCLSCDAIPAPHHPFDYEKVSIYILFYFICVESSASVGKLPSALKFVCETRSKAWLGKLDAARCSRLVKGLKKLAPHFAKQAAPLTLSMIVAAIVVLAPEFELAPSDPRRRAGRKYELWFTQWVTRCLCAHSCMLRADDHDYKQATAWKNMVKGLVIFTPSVQELKMMVVWIPPGKANAKPEPTFHHCEQHVGCFAAWMRHYWIMLQFDSQNRKAMLWPQIVGDQVNWNIPWHVKSFVSLTKTLLKRAGVDPFYVDQITGHSWRCGGLTDYLAAGAPDSFVKLQGRWRSECYRVYLRYSFAYGSEVSARLFASMSKFTSRFAPQLGQRIHSFLKPNFDNPFHLPYIKPFAGIEDDDGI